MRTENWGRWRFVPAVLPAVVCCLLLAGCPGTLTDKERFLVDGGPGLLDATTDTDTGTCGDVVTRIFQPQCGSTGCHGALAPQQGLDLVTAGVAARVVGVSGTACPGTLADPASPETSLLYTKLSSHPPCGAQMPLGQPPLGSADQACILAWIAAQ